MSKKEERKEPVYIGCFDYQKSSTDFHKARGSSTVYNAASCSKQCHGNKKIMLIEDYGNTCLCTTEDIFNKKVKNHPAADESGCNQKCVGVTGKCGDNKAARVYKI